MCRAIQSDPDARPPPPLHTRPRAHTDYSPRKPASPLLVPQSAKDRRCVGRCRHTSLSVQSRFFRRGTPDSSAHPQTRETHRRNLLSNTKSSEMSSQYLRRIQPSRRAVPESHPADRPSVSLSRRYAKPHHRYRSALFCLSEPNALRPESEPSHQSSVARDLPEETPPSRSATQRASAQED